MRRTLSLLAPFLAIAIALAAAPPARAGDVADAALKQAEKALEDREYEEAKKHLDSALSAEPGYAPAMAYLALITYLWGEDGKAREWGGKAEEALAKWKPEREAEEYRQLVAGIKLVLDNPFAREHGAEAAKMAGKTRGGHYLLYTDCGAGDLKKVKAGERTRGHGEIGGLLEKIYDSYSIVFPFEKDKRLVSRVIVFDAREDYDAFGRELDPSLEPESTAGYYDPYYRLLVISNDALGKARGPLYEESMDTTFHEAFHQFIDFFLADAPSWFNEGIAEYFGPSELVAGKKLRVGVVVKEREGGMTRLQVIQRALAGNGDEAPSDLRTLMTMDHEAFMEKADVHYAQAWSFIHYLLHGTPNGKDFLVRYFKALKAGKEWDAAFEEAFGKVDFGALESGWRKYVGGL